MARDSWLPWFIAAFFGCVIAAEIAYNAYTGAWQLITWRIDRTDTGNSYG
jgi:hypothetical protein